MVRPGTQRVGCGSSAGECSLKTLGLGRQFYDGYRNGRLTNEAIVSWLKQRMIRHTKKQRIGGDVALVVDLEYMSGMPCACRRRARLVFGVVLTLVAAVGMVIARRDRRRPRAPRRWLATLRPSPSLRRC